MVIPTIAPFLPFSLYGSRKNITVSVKNATPVSSMFKGVQNVDTINSSVSMNEGDKGVNNVFITTPVMKKNSQRPVNFL